jgi:hypothetical protein
MRAQDYDLAWALSRRQLDARDPADRDNPALPYHLRWVWDGRDYTGRHCLVRCYHGLGDTLQFARFLPLLARRAASVRVEAQPRLIPLLQRIAAAAGTGIGFTPFDIDRPLPPSDCDLEITELPFALRATPADAPAPYLPPRRAILPPGTVGLCHSAGDWDAGRSIPAALLAPLCDRAPCLSLVSAATRLRVLNSAGCPFDMEATAALVAACDLVITVDTMIAHLAGAMGRPTWLLLKAQPDWRWPTHGHQTPWYPTLHLYHQPRAHDWATVIAQVARDLDAFVSTPAANGAP